MLWFLVTPSCVYPISMSGSEKNLNTCVPRLGTGFAQSMFGLSVCGVFIFLMWACLHADLQWQNLNLNLGLHTVAPFFCVCMGWWRSAKLCHCRSSDALTHSSTDGNLATGAQADRRAVIPDLFLCLFLYLSFRFLIWLCPFVPLSPHICHFVSLIWHVSLSPLPLSLI